MSAALAVDVVVIGAGLVGACCARSLVAQGLSVAVVDATGPVGGTTGSGEGNILLSDKEPGPELTLALRSRQLWDVLAGEEADIEFDPKGGLVVVANEAELSALHLLADAQAAAGVLIERLDPAGVLAAEPAVNPAVAGGIRYSQDAQVLPMAAAGALLAAAARNGAQLVWPARVTGARHDAHGRITAVRTGAGDIAAGTVVNACGPWAGEVAALLGGSLPVRPRRGHILVTEPLPERFIRHKVYEGSYVAAVASDAAVLLGSAVVESTRAGTVLIGSTREFAGWSAQTSTAALAELARRAVAIVPALAGVRAQRSYLGFRPASPDHLPLIGPDVDVAGLVHASGHEGAGIGLAPGTAELVTAIVTGIDGPVAAAPFAPLPVGPGRRVNSPPTFDFDGRPIPFAEGASIGASLWADGVRAFRRTRGAGAPRALFCAIGNCFDCLVDVETGAGTRPVRACRTAATEGLPVRSSESVARPTAPVRTAHPAGGRVREVEIAVVGAGPAGLAAAAAAAGAGARVLLLDAAAAPGGQIHRRSTLVGAVVGLGGTGRDGGVPAGVEHLARVRVVLVEGDQRSGFRLHLDVAGDLPAAAGEPVVPELVRARAVVLCSGATEVVAPFDGWTTPGVLTAGGMQALLKGDGVRAGRQVLVAGTGPLLLVVAAGLAAAGARVTLADESPAGLRQVAGVGLASLRHPATVVQAAGLLATLARHRVQLLPGWRVSAVAQNADARDLRVRLQRGSADRELRVEAVGISHGLAPDVALATQLGADLVRPGPGQWGRRVGVDLDARTSVAGLFAAGELTGVAGAPAAHAEGTLAGLAAAAAVGHPPPTPALRRARRAVAQAAHGARVVSRLWPVPAQWWEDLADAETLCRCEEVPAGSARAAMAAGALTARAVKGRTRVGMGLCQGRVCGPLLGQVLQRQSLAGRGTSDAWLDSRPLAEPVDLARLAALD